ncbi:MAG: S8 family serine peptidase [Flavobacteriia bacterium]
MKALKTTLNRSLLIAGMTLLSLMSEAQQGQVLATVSPQLAEMISMRGTGVGSVNTALGRLITDYRITFIGKAFPASRSVALQNVVEIKCDCDINDLYSAVASNNEYFSRVEMTEAIEVLADPNDYSMAGSDYGLNLINAQAAWDITHGDSSIVIAITDAGYHYGHEDLYGKYNYVGANSSTNYTHGTAVAITAAGGTNNGIGKSSIGYNSSLQLRAMDYNNVLEATYSGAKIINMSWASGCYDSYYYQTIIDEAYTNGSILVAAAGNGGTCGGPSNLVYPAAYNHVIAVSSVGPYDNHERMMGDPASTHQHNSSVDICAPGYDLLTSWAPGTYGAANGSSFAAPLVSGTIALMLDVNPCLSFEQVEEILKSTAVNIDAVNPNYIGQLGAGRLNAGAAVYAAARYGTFNLSGQNTVVCETMAQGITLDVSSVLAPYTVSWNTGDTSLSLNNVASGNYEAIVRDAAGCLGVFTTKIDNLELISATTVIAHPMCSGEGSGSIELVAEGGHGFFTYSWSNGSMSNNMYNLTAGIYEVTMTDGKGCSLTESFELTAPHAIAATLVIENNNYYSNGSLDLTVTGGTGAYTYLWNNGNTTEDIQTNEDGFYEVLITDANGCMVSVNGFLTSNQLGQINADIHDTDMANEPIKNETQESTNESTASVETMEDERVSVSAYPNPSAGEMHITWEGTAISEMIVCNMMGQIVRNASIGSAEGSVLLEQLPAGQYLVSLYDNKGNKITQKVTFQ